MSFERFTKRLSASSEQPHVSIQKRGVIAFNEAAYTALAQPRAVALFFDRPRQVVGILHHHGKIGVGHASTLLERPAHRPL